MKTGAAHSQEVFRSLLNRDGGALPSPPDGTVHLWSFDLSPLQALEGTLAALLSQEERERRGRYVDAHRAGRFAVSRGVLRLVLSGYLGGAAEAVRIAGNAQGKPALPRQEGLADLRFNGARSHDRLLVAVATAREVGVDVEYRGADVDIFAIARRFFSAGEHDALMARADEERQQAFLRLWTRKEALIKADGRGMALVRSVEPRLDVDLPNGDGVDIEGKEFGYRDVDVGEVYQAAVALEGGVPEVIPVSALNLP